MADRYKQLQDEAAEIANRIEAVQAMECGDDGDKVAARDLELEGLMARGADVEKKLDFERRVVESAKSARAAVNRCVPAGEPAAEAGKVRIEAVPFRGKLRAYKDPREAHTVGQWLKAQFAGDLDARQWCHDHGVQVRAMGEAVNSAGGVLVPEIFSSQVIRLVDGYSVWPSAMQNVPMASDSVTATKRLTGVTANWTGENSEIATSDPTATQVQLVAKKLAVGTKISNELLADSAISVADWVTQEFATAIASKLDDAAVNGTGTSSFGGVHGIAVKILVSDYSASVHTAGTGRDTFEELTSADFLGMIAKLPRYATQGAAFYISNQGYALSMQRLDLAAGGKVNLDGGASFQFLGFPVILTDKLPTTSGDLSNSVMCLLGRPDLAGMYGSRQALSVRTSTERYVEYDQTLIQATARADMIWHSLGDTSNAGPVIALKGE